MKAQDNTMHITGGAGDSQINITGGQVSYVYVTSTDNRFNTAIDNLSATSIGQQNNGFIVELGERLYDGDLKLVEDVDVFGRPSRTWTYKNDDIGTYAKKAELIATYTNKVSKGDIYNLLSSTVRDAVTRSWTVTNADSSVSTVYGASFRVTVDGNVVATNSGAAGYWERNSSAAIYTPVDGSTRRGTLTEVYLDPDNNVNIAIINTYVYQATSDYSSSRNDVKMAPVGDTVLALKAGELTLKGEDFDLTNIKTDDYLLITAASETGANYEVQSVKVAEKVTGQVSAYSVDTSVTIDGTTYNYSATTLKTTSGVRHTTYTVGQDAIVVLDAYGNIIAVDEAVSSSSFLFVRDIGSTSTLNATALADAYFADGTNKEITIDRIGSDKNAGNIAGAGKSGYVSKWYTYSVNADGKYVLYALTSGRTNKHADYVGGANADDPTSKIIKNGNVSFMAAPNAVVTPPATNGTAGIANDKTILIVKDKDGEVTAYTGTKAMPDITLITPDDATVYYVEGNKTYVEYAFVDLSSTSATVVDGGATASFLYVLRSANTVYGEDGTRYFTYTVINDETGEYTKPRDFESSIDDLYGLAVDGSHPYELRYKPSINKKDQITSLPKVPDDSSKYFNHAIASGYAITYDDGALNIGTEKFVVDKTSKITLVIIKDATTSALLGDPSADHVVYFQTQPQTIESVLKDKLVQTGWIAGATIAANSTFIDTMYITVKVLTADMGTATVGTYNAVSIYADAAAVNAVNVAAVTPEGYTLTAESGNTAVATVAVAAGNAVNVTPVAAGTTSITVTLTRTSTGDTRTATIPVTIKAVPVVPAPEAPAAEDLTGTGLESQNVTVDSNGKVTITSGVVTSGATGTLKDGGYLTKTNAAMITFTAPAGWKKGNIEKFSIKIRDDRDSFGTDDPSHEDVIDAARGALDSGADEDAFVYYVYNYEDSAKGQSAYAQVTWTNTDGRTVTSVVEVAVGP